MTAIIGNKRRESENLTFNSFLFKRLFPPFLGNLTLLSMLPAFLYGCGSLPDGMEPAYAPPMSKVTLSYDIAGISTLDVFVFQDDILQRLDCYQRFDTMYGWDGTIVSGSGRRRISAIANSPYGKEFWFPLNSRSYLEGVSFSLEDERRESPFMYGEVSVDTGRYVSHDSADLHLEPYTSEIALNSLSCDFSGKPYEGEKISGVRVYLINVSAECGILDKEEAPPRRILNLGKLNEDDMSNFIQPDILMQQVPGMLGKLAANPDIRLRCCQNCCPEETPGTPFTRLVIEGELCGHTYYWSIDINRETDMEAGIRRNRRYTYDIRITGKGTTDPNIPIDKENISINFNVTEWKEKEEYSVAF